MRGPDSTIIVWHAADDREVSRAIWLTGTPGLVVQQSINDDDIYCVTHQRSALVVAMPPCGCFAAAEYTADQLGDCGDWDRPGVEIAADATMRDAAKVLLSGMNASAGAPQAPNPTVARRVRSEAMQR